MLRSAIPIRKWPAAERPRERLLRDGVEEVIDDPAAAMLSSERVALLAEAIRRLPEREQTVVSLYYQEQLTMKEVGGVLGLTESRVAQLHSQAMLRLRLHVRERLVPGEMDA